MYFLYYYKLVHLWKKKRTWIFLYGIPLFIIVLTHQSFSGRISENTAIPVGVVLNDNSVINEKCVESLEQLNGEGGEGIFHVTQCSLEKAKELLEIDKIKGYVIFESVPKLVSKTKNSEMRIVKTILDTYYNEDTRGVLEGKSSWYNMVKTNGGDVSRESIYVIAIVLACLLGGILAMKEVFQMEPYVSSTAVIYSAVPVSKEKIFFYNLLGAFSVHFLMVLILGIYVYQVPLMEGDMKMLPVLTVLFFGAFMGFSLGGLFGSVWKVNQGIKKVVFIGICFIQVLISVLERIQHKFILGVFSVLENKLPSSWLLESIYQMSLGEFSIGMQKRIFFMTVTSIVCLVFVFWRVGRRQYDGF